MMKVSDFDYLWEKCSIDDEELKELLIKRFNQIGLVYTEKECAALLEATLHWGYHEEEGFKERLKEFLDEE